MEIKSIKKTDIDTSFEIVISGEEWTKAIEASKTNLEAKAKNKGHCGCHDGCCGDESKDDCCKDEVKEIKQDQIFDYAITLSESNVFKTLTSSKEFSELRDNLLELPLIVVKSVNDKECKLELTFDTRPEITLPSFDDFKLEAKQAIEIDAKDVEAELQTLIDRSKKAVEITEDKSLEKGDIANINFVGKVDGVAFEGGTADNFDLTIGSGQFIPGFEDQMIGMKKGEIRDVKVQFPKEYHAQDLAGKDAIFTVTLNSIKKEETPELNDAFVKELKIPNVETVVALKEYIHNFMKQQKEIEQDSKFEKKVMEHLSKAILSREPKIMKSKMLEQIKKQQMGQLAQYGIDFDQYMQMVGQDKEKVMAEFEKEASRQTIITLALAQLIKTNNIEVTDEELNKEIENISNAYGVDVETVKSQVPVDAMKSSIQTKKVINNIIEKAQNK